MAKQVRRIKAGEIGPADLKTDETVYVIGLAPFYDNVKTKSNEWGTYECGEVLRKNQRRSVLATLIDSGVNSKSQLDVWKAQHTADEIYKIMVDCEDIGFRSAVLWTIALKNQLPSIERILSGVLRKNLLEEITDAGIVYNRVDEVSTRVSEQEIVNCARYTAKRITENLNLKVQPSVDRIIEYAFDDSYVQRFTDGTIMSKVTYAAESGLLELTGELGCESESEATEYELYNLQDEQIDAFRTILGPNKLVVMNGGPGTGKSHVSTAVVHHYGAEHCLVTAYTNKACANLYERLPGYACAGICGIRTITSIACRMEASQKFCAELKNVRCLLIDESSFCSSVCIYEVLKILKACSHNCKLVLVGDANQLPPVGAYGVPFTKLVESGRATIATLTNFRRSNSGGIYDAFCNFRNAGTHTIKACDSVHIHVVGTFEQAAYIASHSYGREDADRLSVIAETNKVCNIVNNATIEYLFPDADYSAEDERYLLNKVGMKVISNTNIRSKAGEVICAKNEICTLVSVGERYTYRRHINGCLFDVVASDALSLSYFGAGYCCTVHKFQGSEENRIIYVLDNDSNMLGNSFSTQKELKYVAFSRAKVELDILGVQSGVGRGRNLDEINVYVAPTRVAQMLF